MSTDTAVKELIESSIDAYVASISAFYESAVRQYLPGITDRILYDLEANGYEIVLKKEEEAEK